nr:synaptobrevin, longin-like domain protein [Tanacetum cinerariifolium]
MVDFIATSPLRRNLKLRDEDGIVSIPDTELFENLTLMGPKSTGFNEFSNNIATALVCLATNRTYNFSKMIFDGMVKNVNNKVSRFLMIVPLFDTMLVHQGEGSGTPTRAYHTPFPEIRTGQPLLSPPPCLMIQHQGLLPLLLMRAQEEEIGRLKERVQVLEDRETVATKQSGEDAPIKGRSNNEGEAAAERISNDSDEITRVIDAPTIPIYAEENLRDPINIRVDIIHPEPVTAVAFPAATVMRTQAQYKEAIRGMQE